MVAPLIFAYTSNMVAPSINMVGLLVMVVPHIICILLHCLWLRLKKKVASPNMLVLLNFAYYQYGCIFYPCGCAASYVYQYGCTASYGCTTDHLRFLAAPMVASPNNMVAPPNIWLCRLALHDIDMVAPSINMVAPLVMVAPPIFCVWLHPLWLHLRKLWLHRFHNYGCAV